MGVPKVVLIVVLGSENLVVLEAGDRCSVDEREAADKTESLG